MLQAAIELPTSPHGIGAGNEKGGSGKPTVAMHIVVALMKAGQRVATIDLDSRQKSLTHYIANRGAWAKRPHAMLELPVHFSVARAEGTKVGENEATEFADCDRAITAVQHCHFLVIDTPPHDSYLMRLGPSIADALAELDVIMPCTAPDPWCLIARQEVRTLRDSLRLPLDERGRRRAAARAQWCASRDNPLDTHDILDA